MNRRAACVMISMAAACFHASLGAEMVVGDVAIQDLTPKPSPVDANNPTVIVAANSAKTKTLGIYGTVGLCDVLTTYPESNRISPEYGASEVFAFKKPTFPYAHIDLIEDMELSRITVLEYPIHGQLLPDGRSFNYVAEKGYLGPDKAVFLVDSLLGQKIKVVQYINVAKQAVLPPNYDATPKERQAYKKTYCPRNSWLISSHSAIDAFSSAKESVSAWLRSSELSSLIASASQTLIGFQDLAGSSVGQTTGEGATAQITLDTTAAGHGWYIDPTPTTAGAFDPFNTDDYLPTSNPTIWQAKVGSEAAGKMDMLSVLLHEYGHALGLEHSADSADFMSATLQPGQRRLPSADELTLMSQLVAQLKASTTLADGSASVKSKTTAPDAPSRSMMTPWWRA